MDIYTVTYACYYNANGHCNLTSKTKICLTENDALKLANEIITEINDPEQGTCPPCEFKNKFENPQNDNKIFLYRGFNDTHEQPLIDEHICITKHTLN